jgi:hypothetical protein
VNNINDGLLNVSDSHIHLVTKWWVETFKNFELKIGTSWQMSLEMK